MEMDEEVEEFNLSDADLKPVAVSRMERQFLL